MRFKHSFRHFGDATRDERGTVAIIFGLLFTLILAMGGSAIDFARSYNERAALQAAGDAAAVAAARQRFFDKSTTKMGDEVDMLFASNYTGQLTNARAVMSPETGQVRVLTTATMPTTLLSVVGINYLDISTVSTARIPRSIDAEIVFVLDYSSSMNSSGKYDTMRDSAIQLINDLTSNKKGADQNLKFALVPFANYVYGKFPKKYLTGYDATDGGDEETCVNTPAYPYVTSGATPDPTDDNQRWVDMKPTGTDVCKPYKDNDLEVLPLTDDTNKVIDQLQDMTPHALTNISLGLSIGWHVISENEPFDAGVPYTDTVTRKFIILLSDGRQTVPNQGAGGTNSIAAAETNLEEMCANIATKNVSLVTVAFDITDTATEDRLRNCATEPSYYFNADTNSDLTTTFQKITEMLADNLRLVK